MIKNRRLETIDEDALRREVRGLMRHFIADYDRVVEQRRQVLPHMLEAHRRVWRPISAWIDSLRGRVDARSAGQ